MVLKVRYAQGMTRTACAKLYSYIPDEKHAICRSPCLATFLPSATSRGMALPGPDRDSLQASNCFMAGHPQRLILRLCSAYGQPCFGRLLSATFCPG